MYIKNYNNWNRLFENKDEYTKYYISSKPKYVYRRSGLNKDKTPNWQYQLKSGEKYWHTVENASSIQNLNAQYKKNLSKAKTDKLQGNTDYWTLIVIMACENYTTKNYSGSKQAMADVAQAIYNRYNTPGKPYGKTLQKVILSPGQYQPVKDGKAKGAKWNSINNKDEAIEVYRKSKGRSLEESTVQINDAISAQKSSSLRSAASKHVGSRTEFLAATPSSKGAAGIAERKPKGFNNCFYWRYAGKTEFYNKKNTAATSIPNSVKNT
jgi:hypothetical protein